MPQTSSNRLLPIAKEGFPFIIPLLGVGALILWMGYLYSGLFCLVTGLFCAFFFRDPERKIPEDPQAAVSPADGKIIGIEQVEMAGFSEPVIKVSIFLSVFNVHINRSPVTGKVESVTYSPGKFKMAFADKASSDNEHNTLVIAGDRIKVMVKQIAGLIARRVICLVQQGDVVCKGERFGLIRFGSRVEIFLPRTKVQLNVKVGDKVKGGESIIALVGR